MGIRDGSRFERDVRVLVEQLDGMVKRRDEGSPYRRNDYMRGYERGESAAFAMARDWLAELLPEREEVDA